jgi:hypothetical protein
VRCEGMGNGGLAVRSAVPLRASVASQFSASQHRVLHTRTHCAQIFLLSRPLVSGLTAPPGLLLAPAASVLDDRTEFAARVVQQGVGG